MVALKRDTKAPTSRHTSVKQERRGGIETGFANILCDIGQEKQERRGGIETRRRWSSAARPRQKQERRGGIETAMNLSLALGTGGEAGTPWWH